jgi:outer membrane protein OmpA-like peptidoglycan-associated protein
MNKFIFFTLFSLICISAFTQALNRENLGPLINSPTADFSAYMTPDGSKMYFIRDMHPQNPTVNFDQYNWVCDMQNDSVVSEAKLLGWPFNIGSSNSVDYQSADGNLVIIRGVYDANDNYIKSGYSYSILGTNGWSRRKEVLIEGYDDMCLGKFAAMCVAPSGNVMLLSFSEEPGSPHSMLYVTKRIDDEHWTRPQRLAITKKGDYGPFMAADNKTLYFTSLKRKGFGKEDIYVSKRLDDTWLNWSEPENAGPMINTKKTESNFTISPSGKYAFMDSYSFKTSSDIFRLKLPQAEDPKEVIVAKPDPVIIVEGIVYDAETQKILGASLSYTNLANNHLEGIGRSSVIDGSYKVILPYGSNYGIGAKLEGYYSEDVNLDLSTIGEFGVVKKDIYLRPIKAESVIRLNNIFFETAKATLLPTSQTELDRLVKILEENPKMVIEIRGHTDNQGGVEFNQGLSENRAKAVVTYLQSKGIAAARLSSKGFGEKSPATTNDTAEGRAVNRRVEFRIISVK